MINAVDIAYDAFIDQVDHNIESAGPSEDLVTAVQANDIDAVLLALRGMTLRAGRKAKNLWLGSPPGTILFNSSLGQSAQRGMKPSGQPVWQMSDNAGNSWERFDPVLEPEDQWKCVVDPTKTSK